MDIVVVLNTTNNYSQYHQKKITKKDELMIISILNKKGGVGKTPFAFSIAKDLSLYLQSNDTSCIEQIYPNYAVITDSPKLIDNCVYDFGGFKSAGVLVSR